MRIFIRTLLILCIFNKPGFNSKLRNVFKVKIILFTFGYVGSIAEMLEIPC